VDRVYTAISIYGAGTKNAYAYAAGISLAVDSRWMGFDLNVDAIGVEDITGKFNSSGTDPAAWGSSHLSWSIVSTPFAHLRLLTGASMLSLPNSRFTQAQPWAGKTIFGPDLGLSGQFGVTGPIGIEGYGRVTPYPFLATDYYGGLVIHGGPIGLMAGWRWVDIRGDDQHRDAPKITFNGPQFGLSVRF
jgi:hypothetical protein